MPPPTPGICTALPNATNPSRITTSAKPSFAVAGNARQTHQNAPAITHPFDDRIKHQQQRVAPASRVDCIPSSNDSRIVRIVRSSLFGKKARPFSSCLLHRSRELAQRDQQRQADRAGDSCGIAAGFQNHARFRSGLDGTLEETCVSAMPKISRTISRSSIRSTIQAAIWLENVTPSFLAIR